MVIKNKIITCNDECDLLLPIRLMLNRLPNLQ